MDKTQKLDFLNAAYAQCVQEGRVRTRGEFAALIGIDRSGLSAAMNGNEKYLTDSLVNKVRSAVPFHPSSGTPGTPGTKPDITIPAAVADLYKNMAESNKELSSTVKTQQDTIRMLVEMIREEKGEVRKAAL